MDKYSSAKFTNNKGNVRHTYLIFFEHLPKAFIARVLIEPSPAAGQNIVNCWIHCSYYMLLWRWRRRRL